MTQPQILWERYADPDSYLRRQIVEAGVRADGRALLQTRFSEVERQVLSRSVAAGSALVRRGGTVVLAAVSVGARGKYRVEAPCLGQGRREAAAVNAPALQSFVERVLVPVWRVSHASGNLCVEALVLGADGSVRDVLTAAVDAARAQAAREGASGDGGLLHPPATRLAAYTYALMVAPPAVSATLGDIDKPVSPSVIVADPTAAEESAAVAATSVTVVVAYDEPARAMPHLHHLECVGAPAAPPLIQQCIDLSLKAHHPATDA